MDFFVGWEVGCGYQVPQFSGLGSWIAVALLGARETQKKHKFGERLLGKVSLVLDWLCSKTPR